jgi:hypothetical protein
MIKNFLKGTRGDAINTLMTAAYNMLPLIAHVSRWLERGYGRLD